MKLLKVAAASLNQTPLDWDANTRTILGAIDEARGRGASMLCLPEMCITGYGCEDALHSPHVCEMAWEILMQDIAPRTRGMVVSVGLPILYNNGLYNCACLLVDGRPLGFVAKQFLAGDGLHYEPRWFKPWPEDQVAWLKRDGVRYPIGDLYFDVGEVRIGFEICEDAWVAKRPGSDLSFKAVDVILNPSASHFAFGKLEVRKRFVIEGSRAFGVTYVYSNLLGNEAGRAIYDGGAVIASNGDLRATGPRFSYEDFQVTTATVDIEQTRVDRVRMVSYRPWIETEKDDCVVADFPWPELEPALEIRAEVAPWEAYDAAHKEEEFTRAVSLALFDYLRKSYSHGFVVSLSGGADSSAVACLVALMVRMGVDELGLDGFLEKLSYIDPLQQAQSVEDIVFYLLTCAYQGTRNSSETTLDAARSLAEAICARFYRLDVDDLVNGYVGMVEGAIERDLTWERDDVTLQNIQARVRAPGIWMFANIGRSLLLSTSNRSEAAVGYATMDGDTAGGLSPIAGIDKAFLRRWLRWMETDGPRGHGPIPALHKVNVQQPTAELRPPAEDQTDEGDLMPYDLLDAIERAHIRDKKSPIEVFRMMRVRFPDYTPRQLGVWVARFFRLWCRNQWKRERYAPSFHLDEQSLDPRTWYRFPILNGGFARELRALEAHVEALERQMDQEES